MMKEGRDATLLLLNGISKAYGSKAILCGVHLSVACGDVAAVVGRNGSGKSTLLSIAAGYLRPDTGDVLLDGASLYAQRSAARRVGFVPQGDNLFEDLTVWDNVRFWASASGVKLESVSDCPFAEVLELSGFAREKVKNCSGGMRRRAAICAALVANPDVLVLDEPFAGLDLYYKSELAARLKTLAALGKTMIYSTHGGGEIEDFASHVYCLNDRRIVYGASVRDIDASAGPLNKLLINLIRGEEFDERPESTR